MLEKDDWRLQGQESYLRGAVPRWDKWHRPAWNPTWDHDHCAFCWKRITDLAIPDAIHEAYATLDEYHWICSTCVEDFKTLFQFTIEPENG